MGQPKSIFDLPADDAEDGRLDAIGIAELDAGHGVPHEQVRDWLAKLGRGQKVLFPKSYGPRVAQLRPKGPRNKSADEMLL